MLVFVSTATTGDQATVLSHLQAAIASCMFLFSFLPPALHSPHTWEKALKTGYILFLPCLKPYSGFPSHGKIHTPTAAHLDLRDVPLPAFQPHLTPPIHCSHSGLLSAFQPRWPCYLARGVIFAGMPSLWSQRGWLLLSFWSQFRHPTEDHSITLFYSLHSTDLSFSFLFCQYFS